MEIQISIPDANVERVAAAYGSSPGENVTADNLADVLTEKFTEDIRRTVQGHEAGQAATAAARAIVDQPDPLSADVKITFAQAGEAVAEARSARLEAARADAAVEEPVA